MVEGNDFHRVLLASSIRQQVQEDINELELIAQRADPAIGRHQNRGHAEPETGPVHRTTNGDEKVQEADGDSYYIRDGIIIVPRDAVIADGTVI